MDHREKSAGLSRREFIGTAVVAGSAAFLFPRCTGPGGEMLLAAEGFLGGLREDGIATPIPNATWYVAAEVGDGLSYVIPRGSLAGKQFLTADMLLDGNEMIVFLLELQEGESGPVFTFRFSGLNQCSFRLRMPFSLVDQNRWGIEREGAFLKPRCGGDRVDLEKVDRMRLKVSRKSPRPARWCMTPLVAAEREVERLVAPVLTKGPLIDEMGQSTLHEWPAKTRSVDELKRRLETQLVAADGYRWPADFSNWGGWNKRRLGEGSGYFQVRHDGSRWWLVDPDGYAFWSTGMDCVRVDTTARFDGLETALAWTPEPGGEYSEALDLGPDSRQGRYINFLISNCIRAFGREGWRDKWAATAYGEMKRLRFNTVGNWSEWEYARSARFPYVRPMSFRPSRTGNIFRDFPDVFHADFERDAAEFAAQLGDTAEDPAFIGYFLMNEPSWGFASELPAVGMLYITEECATRTALAEHMKTKYPDASALSEAWGTPVSFERLARGRWTGRIPDAAKSDLEEFSTVMAERYFRSLTEACRRVDPNHLNLGMRWAGLPPMWAVQGMRSFDVFSMNCYRERVPSEVTAEIRRLLEMPTLIGEWHFGALDVGLPSSGIGHLRNQEDRARAYRVYLEDAAANPDCVGAHWFTLYDESALGRFDGENYNIGFLDVCNRPYEELCAGAIASHERVYEVASGAVAPFDAALEYLPNLY